MHIFRGKKESNKKAKDKLQKNLLKFLSLLNDYQNQESAVITRQKQKDTLVFTKKNFYEESNQFYFYKSKFIKNNLR